MGTWACALGFAWTPAGAFNYTHLAQFGSAGAAAGQFDNPQGIGVDESTGDIYVADAGNHRIQKFDRAGQFIGAWGKGVVDGAPEGQVCGNTCLEAQSGSGPGEFNTPTAIAVDNSAGSSAGDVYVGDQTNGVVEKFDASGNYLATLSAGRTGPFASIYGVSVDLHGNLWIYDATGEVYEFESSGSEIQQWNTNFGVSPGFTVDASDNVYAVAGFTATEKFTSSGAYLGELDPGNTDTTGLASAPATTKIFADQGEFITQYDAGANPPTSPLTTFGQGTLQSGTGLGVNSKSLDVYVADMGTDRIQVYGPPVPGAPQIEAISAASVGTETADLNATVYTGQADTTYQFEYGTTESYGEDLPLVPAHIGSGLESIHITQNATALSPDSTYHYRLVVSNANGIVRSPDHYFVTFPSSTDSGLPDERAYELVSPTDKGGGDIGIFGQVDAQAAPSGEMVTYGSLTSFGTSQSAPLVSQYISQRTTEGWTTSGISPVTDPAESASLSVPYVGFTEDLASAVLAWPTPLTAGAPLEYPNLYVRDNLTGSYQLIPTRVSANGSEPRFVGASADNSHVVFETSEALTEAATSNARNVYDWTAGHLSLVSIPPGSTTGTPEAGAGNGGENTRGAVAADGSVVFWTDSDRQLYAREDSVTTVKINASQRAPSLGDGNAAFFGATPDGAHVLFGDETPLTNAPTDRGGLYEFDPATGNLRNLSPDNAGESSLQGVVGYSADGAIVYFVAEDELAAGATAGKDNLYVSHNGTLTFIATLSSGDQADWTGEPAASHSDVSMDGKHAVFMSEANLTGYNNSDMNTGQPDNEVFEYDFESNQLHCVSCNPTGERPIGPAIVPNRLNANYEPRYLSQDGNRVFFNSADDLSLTDTNGVQDVYEWERGGRCVRPTGCIYLISSGTGDEASLFVDASTNGDDVFFTTSSRLVSQDTDNAIDMYDARVGGGVSGMSDSAPCSGEVCQGTLSTPPALETPPTALGLSLMSPPPAKRPKFTVAPLGKLAVTELARVGRLTLTVKVSEAGIIVVKVTTRIAGHIRPAGSRLVDARTGGAFKFALTLARSVRRALASRHRLKLEIAVSYSHVPRPITLAASVGGGQ